MDTPDTEEAVKIKHKGLFAALAAFQAELPIIAKDSKADAGKYRYTYAGLAAVAQAILPVLGRHGLAFVALPTLNDQGRLILAYKLVHESGGTIEGVYDLPQTNDPQQRGSAITYARRYCLLAVTGCFPEDEDDDAVGATAAARRAVEPELAEVQPREDETYADAGFDFYVDGLPTNLAEHANLYARAVLRRDDLPTPHQRAAWLRRIYMLSQQATTMPQWNTIRQAAVRTGILAAIHPGGNLTIQEILDAARQRIQSTTHQE